jgi:FkbM family methyltransferase
MPLSRTRSALLAEIRKRGIQVKRMPPALIQQPEEVSLEMTVAHLAARHLLEPDPDFFFVQIGAFDGLTGDPLHDLIVRYDWAGILVEPQTRPFEALRATYAGRPRLTLRNVAIDERDEVRLFYRITDGPSVPEWAARLASFDRENILRQDSPQANLRDNLVCENVKCLSFESLLEGVGHVDLLQIDAEGYDATLIHLFDFDRWRPSIVQFEHKHLSLADHDAAIRHLVKHGYRVAAAKVDTVAYRDRRVVGQFESSESPAYPEPISRDPTDSN